MIFGVDTETNKFNYSSTPKLELWCAYNLTEKEYGSKTTEFISFLKTLTESSIFVFYHLAFDWFILFGNKEKVEGFRTKARCFGEFPSYSTLQFTQGSKSVTHTFLDLANYLGILQPLGKLAKTFQTRPKLEVINDNYNDVEYCMRDAEIVHDIYTKHFHAMTPNGKSPRKTISSISYAEFIDMGNWQPFKRYKHIVKKEQNSYYGGIAWLRPDMFNISIDAIKYDINGMYVYCYQDMKVPFAYDKCISRPSLKYISEVYDSDDLDGLIYVTVKIKKWCLPIRQNDGKLSYPENTVYTGWRTLEEIMGHYRNGFLNIEKIYCMHQYKTERGIFKPYAKKYQKQKLHGELTKDPTLRYTAKLKLLTPYGKFAERKRRYKSITNKKLITFLDSQRVEGVLPSEFEAEKLYFENGEYFTYEKSKDEAWGRCTFIASNTTSRARVLIVKDLHKYNAVYCDTDSMVVSKNTKVKLTTDLGGWKVEDQGIFTGYAPKEYRFDDRRTSKGVTKSAIEVEKGVFEFTKLLKPREAIRRGLKPYTYVDTVKRMSWTIDKIKNLDLKN